MIVKESKAGDRSLVASWLQQICSRARVDPGSGVVDLGGVRSVSSEYGCGCKHLEKLVAARKTVIIQLLDGPGSLVPNTRQAIGNCGGGATMVTNPAALDKKEAGNMAVFIDRSNNAQANGRTGYPDPGTPGEPAPLWLILAHELTGHAFHGVQGEIPGNEASAEKQAIISENAHRAEHGLPERTTATHRKPSSHRGIVHAGR